MAYEPKEGDCALFENDKRGNDRAPDRKGYIILHRDAKKGERLEIALWEKPGTGKPFLGGKVSDPRPMSTQLRKPETAPNDDDYIPF